MEREEMEREEWKREGGEGEKRGKRGWYGKGRGEERRRIVRSRVVYCNNSEQYYDGTMRVM